METMDIEQWISQSSATKTEVSARSGVSMSTIHRIHNSQSDPRISTLRELAIACGLDLDISTKPLADPCASQAARVLLEEGFEPDNDVEVKLWLERFDRIGLKDATKLLEYAGRCSGIMSRGKPTVYLRGDISALRLASAGDASNKKWALSGKSHLELGTGKSLLGPEIVWTEDPERVASLLADSAVKARSSATASVIVAAAEPSLFFNSFEVSHVNYVAPIQALLDGFSIGEQLAIAAKEIAEQWNR